MKYTSLELSKKLKENGCELISNQCYPEGKNYLINHPSVNDKMSTHYQDFDHKTNTWTNTEHYTAYDLFWDICVKYSDELFGTGDEMISPSVKCYEILKMIKRNTIQEAEDYIWDNCLFNPKNKAVL